MPRMEQGKARQAGRQACRYALVLNVFPFYGLIKLRFIAVKIKYYVIKMPKLRPKSRCLTQQSAASSKRWAASSEQWAVSSDQSEVSVSSATPAGRNHILNALIKTASEACAKWASHGARTLFPIACILRTSNCSLHLPLQFQLKHALDARPSAVVIWFWHSRSPKGAQKPSGSN